MKALTSILALGTLALAPSLAFADEEAGTWIADFDVAVSMAKEQHKDLLVDFTGSDWCGWCIKLHEEVFSHEAFLKPAQDKYILVALDFPRDPEIKALVPNPERNDELQAKYGVRGFPTVLLMTADGDVFGRTGYQPGGPEAYIEQMTEIASSGKPAIAEVKLLVAAVKNASAETRAAAYGAVIQKALELGADSAPGRGLYDSIKAAVASDPDNAQGLKLKGLKALLKLGAAEEAHHAMAKEIDPKNEQGLFELAVVAQFDGVRNNELALAALTSLEALPVIHDKMEIAGLYATGANWLNGPLQDTPRSKTFAQKAIDLGISDEGTLARMQEILSAE